MDRHPSLLITDDDVSFRETLRVVFEPRGFRTLEAGDGEEALEIVRTEPIDLLLLDVHMPRLSGLETLERLRRRKLELPCILMSAAADDREIRRALRWRGVTFMPKPVTRVNLLEAVQSALERSYDWPQ